MSPLNSNSPARPDDCSDCLDAPVSRRAFVQTASVGTAVVSIPGLAYAAPAAAKVEAKQAEAQPESLVKKLYDTITPEQKKEICFDWDHKEDGNLLRTHVSNNWQITEPKINSKFFTSDQQDIIEAIFFGLYDPEFHTSIRKQLKDDAGGYGRRQSIALFGEPGSGKFEFVMTGRHLTIRCDGDSTEHFAFGGPVFYGHAAQGFNEKADHPGNVFWYQALKANGLFDMLDGQQRKAALIPKAPAERLVHFRKSQSGIPGLRLSELSKDQMAHMNEVLTALLKPYRKTDKAEAAECLKSQGGLENCSISFYQSGDIGNDQVWDVWRLEGPSFVWHYRGSPHVHVWVNVADSASAKISTAG